MHNFIQAIKTCIMVKLFITGGRASRPEFWWFTLFAVAVRLVTYPLTTMAYLGIIYSIINFIVFVAQYTALVRRLHDTNRSGLHIAPALAGLLVGLSGFLIMNQMVAYAGMGIAALGIIYVLVLCAFPGTQGDNQYGSPMPLSAKQHLLLTIYQLPITPPKMSAAHFREELKPTKP